MTSNIRGKFTGSNVDDLGYTCFGALVAPRLKYFAVVNIGGAYPGEKIVCVRRKIMRQL